MRLRPLEGGRIDLQPLASLIHRAKDAEMMRRILVGRELEHPRHPEVIFRSRVRRRARHQRFPRGMVALPGEIDLTTHVLRPRAHRGPTPVQENGRVRVEIRMRRYGDESLALFLGRDASLEDDIVYPFRGSKWRTRVNLLNAYDEGWARDFRTIERFLKSHISGTCRVHHVGSTSIPGMPAKPVIDIDVECPPGFLSELIRELDRAGYDHRGDQGIPSREAFKPREHSPAAGLPSHHLYACESTAPELRRHLAFRDYLRAHPARADWLAAEKRRCEAGSATKDAYIEAKAPAYERIVAEALDWAERSRET